MSIVTILSYKSSKKMTTRVLVVCMGNICRMPAAEVVFRHLVNEEDFAGRMENAVS